MSQSRPGTASAKSARPRPTDAELAALAEFRATLRKFLAFSEQAAAAQGVTMQWYQALLVIKTFNSNSPITVGELANQLMIRHHSAAELVSRLEAGKLVRRESDSDDRRKSLLVITAAGERRLADLAAVHLEHLRAVEDSFLKPFKVPATSLGSPDALQAEP
ncbi:MarR family transcriptional regulator [Methylocystis bryophila]|uniref:MarR family transcriptional regulator n=2 Tax=Methylocystis bryophila TaxID=655015 RepID=A0A1W6MU63_9HYPH|nr:MarR family transcriptional regulator [Methylocystis bryophila]